MPRQETLESMLFPYKTTYRGSYKGCKDSIRGRLPDKVVEKVNTPRPRPTFVSLDLEALTPYNKKYTTLPFTLFHKPKDILQTNPRKMQERYVRPTDEKRAAVQKTRTKVLMTPAIHLDALTDPQYETLIKNMYKSTTAKSLEDAAALSMIGVKNVKAPLPGVYSKCNPVKNDIEPVKPPYVSPEWRRQSVLWDNKQLRTHADATKTFWLNREPLKFPTDDYIQLKWVNTVLF